jgi:hypothetical protein
MARSVADQEESLGQFLATRARGASDARLAGDAIAALLTAVAIGFWRGPAWDIRIAVAACLLAFGIWGIADRDLARISASPRHALILLRATRIAAAVLGFAAAAFLLIALVGKAIGRVIS